MFSYNFSPPSSVIFISGPKASARAGHEHDPARSSNHKREPRRAWVCVSEACSRRLGHLSLQHFYITVPIFISDFGLFRMGISTSWLHLPLMLAHILIFQFSLRTTAIRKDIGVQVVRQCKTTVQGRYFLSDDNGYVCNALSVDSQSRCCPEIGEKFSCHGCNLLSRCCNSYEYCVSCCLNPARTNKEDALKVKIAKPASARMYASVFDYCAGRCRHSSESVVHENAYLSDFHHCFLLPSNSSAGIDSILQEARLNGIHVVVGRQGESCDSVCKLRGQSCVPNKLAVLNQCDVMQKYMTCKGACLASVGTDQPAEVVHDAPKHLNPGSCLYTEAQSTLSCDGAHQHTRRLCPCA